MNVKLPISVTKRTADSIREYFGEAGYSIEERKEGEQTALLVDAPGYEITPLLEVIDGKWWFYVRIPKAARGRGRSCPMCDGMGEVPCPETEAQVCPACRGDGRVSFEAAGCYFIGYGLGILWGDSESETHRKAAGEEFEKARRAFEGRE